MSRIGKKAVKIPKGVEVGIADGEVRIKGQKGSLVMALHPSIQVEKKDDTVSVLLKPGKEQYSAVWGMTRAKLASLMVGVEKGFERVLELHGVGYRVTQKGAVLEMQLGFSHPVRYEVPAGVQAKVPKDTVIILNSTNKELLGQTAATIRGLRVPDVYQNKGIRYQGERLRKKAGKSGAAKGG
jgi:large subunit ribosomal protein L6